MKQIEEREKENERDSKIASVFTTLAMFGLRNDHSFHFY